MERKYIFEQKSDFSTHYEADVFVLSCTDFRGKSVLENFLENTKCLIWDNNSPPGGLRVFASPLHDYEPEMHALYIEMLCHLHHFKKIFLFSHTNCGAYGGLEKFGCDKEKEFEFHVAEHKKARDFLRKKFPDLKVETYFIDEKGVVKTG